MHLLIELNHDLSQSTMPLANLLPVSPIKYIIAPFGHEIEKRFKKAAGFLRNAPEKQFGLRIARYFNHFPLHLSIRGIMNQSSNRTSESRGV